MKNIHTPTPEQLIEADVHEVTCIDSQGNILWTAYSIGPDDGICTLYEMPADAYEAFLAIRDRIKL